MTKTTWLFRESRGDSCVYDSAVSCSGDGGALHYTLQTAVKGHDRGEGDGSRRRSPVVQWLRDAFLPRGYPHSVSGDYIHYQLWDTLQAYCSSVAGSVSLHATLGSLGVGQEGTTPLAATITWLTNTGTGMVAAIAFTYCKGTQLDCNNKQWRLFADVANDLAHLIKLATPLLPLPPLLPFTVAAVLYALVGVAGGATRTALTAHQARCHNLADVAAKDGSQETLVNLAALLTSLLLLPLITHSLGLTWSVFLLLLTAHLFCNYRAVRSVVSPSLNRPRLLLVLQQYAATNTVPTVAGTNAREPLLLGPAFKRDYLAPGWSLELGCSLQRALSSTSASAPPELHDNFMIVASAHEQRAWVVLTREASSRDLLLACWTAYLIARTATRQVLPPSADRRAAYDVEPVRSKAADSFPQLLSMMLQQGWNVEDIYLDVEEWRVLERVVTVACSTHSELATQPQQHNITEN